MQPCFSSKEFSFKNQSWCKHLLQVISIMRAIFAQTQNIIYTTHILIRKYPSLLGTTKAACFTSRKTYSSQNINYICMGSKQEYEFPNYKNQILHLLYAKILWRNNHWSWCKRLFYCLNNENTITVLKNCTIWKP